MAAINVNRVVEVSIDLTMGEDEASELLYVLRTAVTPPRAPSIKPYPTIVRDIADALIVKGVK